MGRTLRRERICGDNLALTPLTTILHDILPHYRCFAIAKHLTMAIGAIQSMSLNPIPALRIPIVGYEASSRPQNISYILRPPTRFSPHHRNSRLESGFPNML